jgi:hypothetical protein
MNEQSKVLVKMGKTEYSLPPIRLLLSLPFVFGSAVYAIYWASSAKDVIPARYLPVGEDEIKVGLRACILPITLMLIQAISVMICRVLTTSGDMIGSRKFTFVEAMAKNLRNSFEQTFIFVFNALLFA